MASYGSAATGEFTFRQFCFPMTRVHIHDGAGSRETAAASAAKKGRVAPRGRPMWPALREPKPTHRRENVGAAADAPVSALPCQM